jgi:hypothetical protein
MKNFNLRPTKINGRVKKIIISRISCPNQGSLIDINVILDIILFNSSINFRGPLIKVLKHSISNTFQFSFLNSINTRSIPNHSRHIPSKLRYVPTVCKML